MEFPYGWNLFNQSPIIEIFIHCMWCIMHTLFLMIHSWMWCSWMMLWLWSSCPTQQLQHWLLSFWMSHCLVRMMLHVKTLVCSGGRGSACTVQMLRMMSSTLYHADLISFFHPLSTTTTTYCFFLFSTFFFSVINANLVPHLFFFSISLSKLCVVSLWCVWSSWGEKCVRHLLLQGSIVVHLISHVLFHVPRVIFVLEWVFWKCCHIIQN